MVELDYGVFLDLQKAFDTVNHKILLRNLSITGYRVINVSSWFQSCLTGKTPVLFPINGHVSTTSSIICGAPQGSGGPWPITIFYMSMILSVSQVLKFYLFADDTSIYSNDLDLFTLRKVVNKGTQKVKKCLDANRALSLNIAKTNFVIFHSKPKNFK